MTEADKPKLFTLIAEVMAFYRQDVSSFALQVWWQACSQFDFEQVAKALTGHATDAERGQFPPKPADLMRQLKGTSTDRAMLAWGKVNNAMSSVGAYTDVIFDDPAIHAAIDDLGGWAKVCRSEIKELSYLQHRFCEAHKAYTARGAFEYPRKLCGEQSPDETFAKFGLKPPAPAIVGQLELAKKVYQLGVSGGKVQINFTPIQVIENNTKLITGAN
jgi:hypothetical protein